MANGHYGPTPLRMVHWGAQTYLGGGCRRFGCDHTFAQHDLGRPDGGEGGGGSGGQCRGIKTSACGTETPCACESYRDSG